jgi:hypothetical protein
MIGRNSPVEASPVEASEECAAAIFEDLFGYEPATLGSHYDDDDWNDNSAVDFSWARGGEGTLNEVNIELKQMFGNFETAQPDPEVKISICFPGSTQGQKELCATVDATGLTVSEAIALLKGPMIAQMG